jgi:hypothetical protein
MTEIDERYKRGMIYTIRNIKDDTMIYVGSTINTLSKRFDNHKSDCKCGKSAINLYSHIKNNDWVDWYIELYEVYPCNNKKELNRREGQVIREIGTINKCIAGRTMKEYNQEFRDVKIKWWKDNIIRMTELKKQNYINNREEIAKKHKQYYQENSEKIAKRQNEKVCCNICGAFSSKNHLPRHQKSKSCMSKIPNNTDIPSDTHI